jgi:hypothetical protein
MAAILLRAASSRLAPGWQGVFASEFRDRYSFIVMDFHHLLLAGFYRRTSLLDFRTNAKAPIAVGRCGKFAQ